MRSHMDARSGECISIRLPAIAGGWGVLGEGDAEVLEEEEDGEGVERAGWVKMGESAGGR